MLSGIFPQDEIFVDATNENSVRVKQDIKLLKRDSINKEELDFIIGSVESC